MKIPSPKIAGAALLALGVGLLSFGMQPLMNPAKAQVETTERVTLLPDRIILPPQCGCSVTLTDYDVSTSIKDNVATTTIVQTFKNESGRTLEARYLFPLPQDANFSSFTLTMNGKALEGKIMEKDAARATYQDIVRRLVDPGLLEYLDDKTVQASVAPFFAGETKKIQLSYTQLLAQDGGLYKYTYNLGSPQPSTINGGGGVVPPRPVPMQRDSSKSIRHIPRPEPVPQASFPGVDLKLDLKTSQSLKTVYSPTHTPDIDRNGNTGAKIALTVNPAQLQKEKNFVLYFSQDNSNVTLNSLNYQKAGEAGYFLMTVRTPDTLKDQPVLPKDIVFVIDTSGSMGGDKMVQAKDALKTVLAKLRPEDSFGVLQFNTDVSSFKSELIPATAENKKAAIAYADNLEASGSTNIEGALQSGFAQLKNHKAGRPAYLIFLTDVEPTVGITDTAGLLKTAATGNTVDARIFDFGVGYDVKTDLLDKLAEANHGSATYVEPNENLELAVTGFYNKIEAPVLTDVAVDWGGLQVTRVYPDKVGDLFAGSEVILMGRHGSNQPVAEKGVVKLTGKVGSQVKTYSYPVSWTADTSHSQLPRLWAGRRIAYLLDNMRQNGEKSETKEEVVSLSKQYGIITPYTSFLAVEPEYAAEAKERDKRSSFDMGAPGGGGSSPPPPASAPAVANQAAMRANSGQGSVQFSKTLGKMKAQSSVADLDAAQEIGGLEGRAITLKTVANKTFTLSTEGVWTDTAYEEKTHGKPQRIAFGTDGYFDLLSKKPALLPYFALGEQVLVVLDGVAYEVLTPRVN